MLTNAVRLCGEFDLNNASYEWDARTTTTASAGSDLDVVEGVALAGPNEGTDLACVDVVTGADHGVIGESGAVFRARGNDLRWGVVVPTDEIADCCKWVGGILHDLIMSCSVRRTMGPTAPICPQFVTLRCRGKIGAAQDKGGS